MEKLSKFWTYEAFQYTLIDVTTHYITNNYKQNK